MLADETTPAFNLKVVIQETGLKPDTLRAWERRYGLPTPARTSGRHRLYSQRDIDTLKWLMARQGEGLSISRAVAMWREQEEQGVDPLLDEIAHIEESSPIEIGQSLTGIRKAWINACLNFDEQTAEIILTQAFALYPPEVTCFEVMQMGLSEIGLGWYEGKLTAQQEHFASGLALRRLSALLAATPPPTRPGRIIIGCPPYEEHTFSPLLLTLLLRRRSWDVVYLGANVPTARLEEMIKRNKPRLAVFSAQTLHTAATLVDIADVVRRANVPLAYGGLVFNLLPEARKHLSGHFLGQSLQSAPAVIEKLMNSSLSFADAQPLASKYHTALTEFREHRPRLEAQVWQAIGSDVVAPDHLYEANSNLSRSIMSALALGDIDLLGHDIAWVKGLLNNYRFEMTAEMMQHYLSAYHTAASETLGRTNGLVLDWLAKASQQ